jgi:holo-[acyl-carrier protein] synthase
VILGIGVDAVEIARVETALARTPRLRERLFTEHELQTCGAVTARLAARFAAKEAVAKALGTGIRGFAFKDVEIRTEASGRPVVRLHAAAANAADALGVGQVHLTLSTSRQLALACAVAVG